MSALLLSLLFVLGVIVALVVTANAAPRQGVRNAPSTSTKLDTVDEMFLYGEVAEDDFYRM